MFYLFVAILIQTHLVDRQGGKLPLMGNITKDETRRFIIPEGGQPQLGNKGDDILLIKDGEIIHQVSYPKAGSGHIFQFDKPGGGVVVPPGSGEPEPVLPPGADPC